METIMLCGLGFTRSGSGIRMFCLPCLAFGTHVPLLVSILSPHCCPSFKQFMWDFLRITSGFQKLGALIGVQMVRIVACDAVCKGDPYFGSSNPS